MPACPCFPIEKDVSVAFFGASHTLLETNPSRELMEAVKAELGAGIRAAVDRGKRCFVVNLHSNYQLLAAQQVLAVKADIPGLVCVRADPPRTTDGLVQSSAADRHIFV